MDDPRIKQLEKDIENEVQTSKSRYAFTGFGRSTDTMTSTISVEKEGVKLAGGLQSLISAEKWLEGLMQDAASGRGGEGIGEAIGYAQERLKRAQDEFSKLQTAQSKRLKSLSESILGATRSLSLKSRYNSAFRKFRTRPEGRNFLKAKPVSVGRTKKYQPAGKENLAPQRKMTSILANKNRFGARTLQGLKTK